MQRFTTLAVALTITLVPGFGCDSESDPRDAGPIDREHDPEDADAGDDDPGAGVCPEGFENVPTIDDCYQDVACFETPDGSWCSGSCPPASELELDGEGNGECVDAPPCIEGFELVDTEEECVDGRECYELYPLGWCTGDCPEGLEYEPYGFQGPHCSIPDCYPDDDTMCLHGGQYTLEIEWRTPAGGVGHGSPRHDFVSDASGLFTFFSPDNVEMLVKVLPACEISDYTWVFAASATDVAFTLTVTDNYSGQVAVYEKNDFDPAVAITDISAFANCDY